MSDWTSFLEERYIFRLNKGVVTRRPLELRLVHIPDGEGVKPYAVFEEIKNEKFFNFDEVRTKIDFLTDEVAGKKKNIVDKPIILNVYSPTCPDLTLIDLPGITRIPLQGSDQPRDIEKITREMAERYIKDPRTIILCVVPANNDITNSEALQMAQGIDVEGDRTLGVLTKIDIMDHGTDAKNKLLGNEVPLKLGYVGVKCRSQLDIINKVPVKMSLEREKKFFREHSAYRMVPQHHLGTEELTKKLTKIFFKQIKATLPDIIRELGTKIKECEEKIHSLGNPLPLDSIGKLNLLWTMLSEYCETFKNILKGKYDSGRTAFFKNEGGYKIKEKFRSLLEKFTGDYKATAKYTVEKF